MYNETHINNDNKSLNDDKSVYYKF